MEHYRNDYTEKDDPALWQLHKIRQKIAGQSPEQINSAGREIIKKYGLDNLTIVRLPSGTVLKNSLLSEKKTA